MTLYLLEINDQGLVQQLAIVEGELDDFKDSTVFKAFTSYEEAQSKLGKRWTGSLWEDIPKQQEEEKPKKVETLDEKVNKLATSILALEDAVATMYEDDKKRSVQVDETLATIYEELVAKKES
nr:MAG TPA: hypothetical protein [Caudoviricetes sp.]